jgi:hypothetical protein
MEIIEAVRHYDRTILSLRAGHDKMGNSPRSNRRAQL